MRCKNCGVENADDTEYCRYCGYGLNESSSLDITRVKMQNQFKKIYYIYFTAITFLIVSFFIPIIYNYFFSTPLNPILGALNLILLIIGSLFTIYFYILFYKKKDELKGQEPYYSQIKNIAILLLLLLITILVNYVTGY
ncbi:MAG: zinc ribbon domain-containing protein [Methanobacterium sp. ERen5]|nr:MAG: zinc ribbon domain-containing protein [Methanobacterium sp. ERen5]